MQIDINEDKKLDDLSNNSKYKKFILIKVPAKVKNKDKATSLLGGCGNIIHKYFKNENIDLKLFHKKLPLEKCICNDLIIKRKTKRSKTNPSLIKHEYEIIGKADCQYECFAMHDFVYFNKYSNSSIDELKSFCINKDDYIHELSKLRGDEDKMDECVCYSQTQKTQSIHNIQESINELEEIDKEYDEEICQHFQPSQISNLRNSYAKPFKELYEDVPIDEIENEE